MEDIKRWFERFRRSGDTDALGRVFDATAPRLLQLAVHLVGDLAAAEDLVQATFVTAIERADKFDESRELEAWLAGILANHARDLNKAARRTIDVASLAERIESTPLEQALDAEWSAALAQALDRIPEPYRVVLILRLQHGMEPTEIAHALNRSPGAVRVQLHRGREMLRKELPAGILASALFIAEPGRGLAQIKATVVAHAALAKSSVGIAAITGGLLVSSKVLISAAAIVIALLALFFARSREHEAAPAMVSMTAAETRPLDASVAPHDVVAPVEPTAPAQREEASPPAPASSVKLLKLHGRVYDSDTNAGIAGAEVRLFPPQTTRLSDVRRRWHDRLEIYKDGTVTACWPAIHAVPPAEKREDKEVGTDFTSAARLDAQDITVYAPPAPATDAIARAVSDANGEFEVRAPESLGFLVCTANGYATRERAVDPDKLNKAGADDVTIQVAMSAPKPLAGYVVDEKLKRIERSVRLRFEGHIRKPPRIARDMRTGEMTGERDTDPQMDSWVVETKPDGSFECELPANMVYAQCLEPDLDIVKQGHLHDGGTTFVDDVWPEPGHVDEPLVIVLQSVTSLAVRDRESQRPIDDIHLLCTRDSNGFLVRWGRFFAPSGKLRLSSHNAVDSAMHPIDEELAPRTCTVWADGYLPATKKLRDLTRPGVIEFELERGEAPSVSGRVHDGDHALSRAHVQLVGPVRDAWYPPQGAGGVPIEMVVTDGDGAFRIGAPAGRYVLGVFAGEHLDYRIIELPSMSPVDIDFSIDTSIVVDVHESTGVPCTRHEVVLRADDGRQVKMTTDAKGIACFSRLAPGGYAVRTMNAAVRVDSKPDRETHVDLHLGERASAEFVIADLTPRFAHLVVDGAPSLAGWRAHWHHLGEDGPRVNVEPNGRVPTDIRGMRLLQIIAPDAREWTAFLPTDAPDGYEVRVTLDGIAYEGVVTSQSNGRPMPGLQVIARQWDAEDGISTTARTDDHGRFKLSGLVDGEYSVYFKRDSSDERYYELEGIYLHIREHPRSPPAQLAIALPRRKGSMNNGYGARGFDGVPELTLSGTIHKVSGPLPRIGGFIGSCFPREGYTLTLYTTLDVSSDGTYETRVPAAPRYRVSLRDGPTSIGESDWAATGTSDREVHDIEIP